MRRILFYTIILVWAFSSSAYAQEERSSITFKKTVNDFGTIKEEDGPVSYIFEFANTGKAPLIMQRVITSDYISTEWPKEPIAPGAAGSIKVSINPTGLTGVFDKIVTVYSNAQTTSIILHLKGIVKERAKALEEVYTRIIGDFRFKTTYLSFDRIYIDKVKTDTLEFVSIAKEPVKIGCNLSSLPHLSISFVPETIKPNEKGLMIIKYNPKKRDEWGFVIDRFFLLQNDKKIDGSLISLSASIEENFSNLTEEQRLKAPRIEFVKTDFDFGTIDEGQTVEYEFTFKNIGKKDLVIRRIKASCGCTTVEPADKVIKPSMSSSFKASLKTKGLSGRNAKSITVISNDPVTPTVVLRISGIVNSVKK
jgi:hypothetical protein